MASLSRLVPGLNSQGHISNFTQGVLNYKTKQAATQSTFRNAASNQPPTTHAGPSTYSPLTISRKRSSPFPLLVNSHANKRAIHNSAFNISHLAAMGHSISGLDPYQVNQIPLDVSHQRAH
jgi:hypothetical protein